MELILVPLGALVVYVIYVIAKKINSRIQRNKAAKQAERKRTEEKVGSLKSRFSAINNSDVSQVRLSERKYSQTDIYNTISEMMCEDVKKIGWTNWNPEIHASREQLDRIERASGSTNGISLWQYSPNTTAGIVKGRSGKVYFTCGNGCSCPDFRKRGLPCKHMYFIAINHDDYKNLLTKNNYVPYDAEDNVLYGLNFCILGKNHAVVENYIKKHAGTFGQNSWWNISAVVVNGDTQSQKLLSAQENRVIVMTFDELKAFCEDINNQYE